jgi:plasmid stabilization system protein ParE
MKLPVIVLPEAENDLALTRAWYEEQKAGLGDKFAAEVAGVFRQLAAMPELFAAEWLDIRLCGLRRFPYVIFYRILVDRVEVLAVLHGGRDPSVWQSRV